MTWLTPDPGEHPAKRLRGTLEPPGALAVPGVTDGLAALLAKDAGAQVLMLSGAGLSAAMGMPDVRLVTLDELARVARQIVRVTRLPLLVDADAGFGSPLMVMRTVRELEGARCAAIVLEDRTDPARTPATQDPPIAPMEDAIERIRAAVTSRQQLVVVARTDARGLEDAVRRGLAYREAGADLICPGSLRTEGDLAALAREVPGPLLADADALTDDLPVGRLGDLGYRLVAFPLSAARVGAAIGHTFYADLVRQGTHAAWRERMFPRQDLDALLDRDGYAGLAGPLDEDRPSP